MKSTGAPFSLWCSHWKKVCCPSVPGMPQMMGADGTPTAPAIARHPLAQRFHLQLLQVGHQVQQPRAVGRDVQRVVAQHAAIDQTGKRQLRRRIDASGASRKCWSMASAPARMPISTSAPTVSAMDRPATDHTE